jgi:PAS domain S-box-containing protein
MPISADLQSPVSRQALVLARMAGAGGAAVGGLVLVGWLLGSESLTGVWPGLATMKPNTAVCFVLAGLAVRMRADAGGLFQKAAGVCGAIVALLGLLALSQDLFHWSAGIDELLLRTTPAAGDAVHPGRMSPATALGFGLLGLALLSIDVEDVWGLCPFQPLAAAATLLGFVATLGYLYGFRSLYKVPAYSSMALHTAVLFVLLGVATLLSRPERGWLAALTSSYSGAVMARRVFPAGVGLTLLLGWLRTAGERAGWYGPGFGRALVTVGFVFLFAIVIWVHARSLNRTDAAQRQREQQLRASQARLQQSLREVANLRAALDEHAIVAITDQKGTITHVNDKFCDISKYSRQQLLGQHHRILNSGSRPKEFIRELRTMIAHGRVWKGEIRNRAHDGTIYWVDATIVPFADEGGKPYQYVAIGADITALKLADEALIRRSRELSRSNAELEQFAYLASHDLQEPLRGIAGCVDLLRKHYAGQIDDRADEFIGHAVANLARMRDLIQGLLDYSRLDRGKQFKAVDCQALLEGVRRALGVALEESGAQLLFAGLPEVFADRVQLGQLFQNLVANAIKFRGQQRPRIRVSAERLDSINGANGGGWQFAVEDNGMGIEPQHFERVFQIFKRLKARRDYPGTGIGLAVCKKVVERHGGRIWIESEPNQGATFFFTLADVQEGEHRT